MKPTTSYAANDPRAPGLTLARAFAIFVRQPSVHVMAAIAAVAIPLRLWMGNFTVWDPMLVVMLVAFHPMTEWLIHVYVLHFRPRTWGGKTIDFRVSRDHRSHHQDPHDPTFWYIPVPSGLIGFAMIGLFSAVLLPTWSLALTVLCVAPVLGLVYEWTHFLCHCSYRPRSAFYRRIWRHHRWHHFKNEHYWMGVTMHAADHLLGTAPAVGEVETSPTCRDLLK